MTGNKLDCAINTVAEDYGTLKWIHETYIRPQEEKIKRRKGIYPYNLQTMTFRACKECRKRRGIYETMGR